MHRLNEELTREQDGANRNKAQHADYSARLHARLKIEKAEKQSWAEEKSKLQSDYENAKASFLSSFLSRNEHSTNIYLP